MADTLRIKRRPATGAAGAPTSLAAAEIAYNEKDDILYYGKGNSAGMATSIIAIAGPGFSGGSSSTGLVTVADTPPPSPTPGQLWFESDSGVMSLSYQDVDSTQWVQVSGAGPQGVQGQQGIQGPIGPQGPQGPAGAAGTTTTAYSSPISFTKSRSDTLSSYTDIHYYLDIIATLTLTAGNYDLFAQTINTVSTTVNTGAPGLTFGQTNNRLFFTTDNTIVAPPSPLPIPCIQLVPPGSGLNVGGVSNPASATGPSLIVGPYNVNVASTTTIYLAAYIGFAMSSGSNLTWPWTVTYGGSVFGRKYV